MLAFLGGFFLGWSLGANAAANVFGSAVTSRMVKFSTAAFLASVFVIIGALLEGRAGIETLKGLTPLTVTQAVVCSVAAAFTITIMTLLRLPISTAQAAVGAIVGVSFLNQQLNLSGLGKVAACWFATPLGGLILAVIVYHTIAAVYNRLTINLFQADMLLRSSLIIAGSYGAYTLGANNVANVTAVFVGSGQLDILWAAFLGGVSIAFGVLTFSSRVMKTVGYDLVRLDPFSALVVVSAEAITVHIFTFCRGLRFHRSCSGWSRVGGGYS